MPEKPKKANAARAYVAQESSDEDLSSSEDSSTNSPNNETGIVKATSEKGGRQVSVYGFPWKDTASSVEQQWQRAVTLKFFRIGKPLKDGATSHRVYNRIKKYIDSGEAGPLQIKNLNRRSFIIALTKIMTDYDGMPALKFKLGKTTILFKPKAGANVRQKGNFMMEIPELKGFEIKYGENCAQRVEYLVAASWDDSVDRKKRGTELLKHISQRLTTLKPFDSTVFNKYGKICISAEDYGYGSDSAEQSGHLLNGLLFLVTVVEALVRLYRTEDGNVFEYADQRAAVSDSFPVAMAQSRSLILLLHGKISFANFIGETKRKDYDHKQHRAYYGAVTGKSTISHTRVMLEKLSAINTARNAALFSPTNGRSAWKNFHDEYMATHPKGALCQGRSRMYFDLKTVYGSGDESDADSSGYSDEEDADIAGCTTHVLGNT